VEQKVKFPIWFDAIANGGTPMCEALNRAQAILTDWLTQHSGCFPPIVINITDGESTDGDPSSAADKIKSLTSDDGGVLLFNLHLSSQRAAPIEFPDSEAGLPEYMRGIAQQEGFAVSENTRGFVFNADMVSVIRFLDIGTRPSNLR